MMIFPDIHLIDGVIPNVYLVAGPAGISLIDTGIPTQARKILGYIRAQGFQAGDLRRIIITHADFDHVGSLSALVALTQARVAASPIEAHAIRTGNASRAIGGDGLLGRLVQGGSRLLGIRPCPVDKLLVEGDELPMLGGLQVLATPGHTPGHISLWSPSRRILFSGDSLLVRSNRLGQNRHFVGNLEQLLASARRQAALKPLVICGGHGWTDQAIEQQLLLGGLL